MSNKIIVEIRLPSGNADGFDINLEISQKREPLFKTGNGLFMKF